MSCCTCLCRMSEPRRVFSITLAAAVGLVVIFRLLVVRESPAFRNPSNFRVRPTAASSAHPGGCAWLGVVGLGLSVLVAQIRDTVAGRSEVACSRPIFASARGGADLVVRGR